MIVVPVAFHIGCFKFHKSEEEMYRLRGSDLRVVEAKGSIPGVDFGLFLSPFPSEKVAIAEVREEQQRSMFFVACAMVFNHQRSIGNHPWSFHPGFAYGVVFLSRRLVEAEPSVSKKELGSNLSRLVWVRFLDW